MSACDYSGLDEAFCDHCRSGGKPAPRPAPAKFTGWIEARYPGQCRGCGELFSAGTQITASDTDGWIAECCADEAGD